MELLTIHVFTVIQGGVVTHLQKEYTIYRSKIKMYSVKISAQPVTKKCIFLSFLFKMFDFEDTYPHKSVYNEQIKMEYNVVFAS